MGLPWGPFRPTAPWIRKRSPALDLELRLLPPWGPRGAPVGPPWDPRGPPWGSRGAPDWNLFEMTGLETKCWVFVYEKQFDGDFLCRKADCIIRFVFEVIVCAS